jgi:DNA-binding transcriptional LysR family regulator
MKNIKQLPKLLVFAMVAKKKSFTKAAEILQLSKSSVSQSISALENEVGLDLLIRTSRGLSLTPIGEEILLQCEPLQSQIKNIYSYIDSATTSPKGRFTIKFPESLEHSVVLPALRQLCKEYKNLEPKLISSDKPLDLVECGIDFSIHIGEMKDSGYRALPIGRCNEIFCASPLYVQNSSSPITLEKIEEHRWIKMDWQNSKTSISSFSEPLDKCEVRWLKLNACAQTNSIMTAIDMSLGSMGIILVPEATVKRQIENNNLVQVIPNSFGSNWSAYALHAYQNNKPKHWTRFYELIVSSFKSI